MKVFVEITTLDDKTRTYECDGFPSRDPDFMTLSFPKLETLAIRSQTILGYRIYVHEKKKEKGKEKKQGLNPANRAG